MDAKPPSHLRRVFLALALLLAPMALYGGWLPLGEPGFSGVLACTKAADNTDCVITQEWNGSGGEPYTVSFYSRSAGGIWNWQYIDYEAEAWSDCRMEIDAAKNEVKIYNGSMLARTVELHPADRWPEQEPPCLPLIPAALQLPHPKS